MSKKLIIILILITAACFAAGGYFIYQKGYFNFDKEEATEQKTDGIYLDAKWSKGQIETAVRQAGQSETKDVISRAILEEIDRKKAEYLDQLSALNKDRFVSDISGKEELKPGMISDAIIVVRDSEGNVIMPDEENMPQSIVTKAKAAEPLGFLGYNEARKCFNEVPADWQSTLLDLRSQLVSYYGNPIYQDTIYVCFNNEAVMGNLNGISEYFYDSIPRYVLYISAYKMQESGYVLKNPDFLKAIFLHEYSHASRYPKMIITNGAANSWKEVWEEGLAESAVDLVMGNYCSSALNTLETFNLPFRGPMGVYSWRPDALNSGCGLWLKAYIGDNNFFKNFYDKLKRVNNTVDLTNAQLQDMTIKSFSVGTVEGKTKKDWVESQAYLRTDNVQGGVVYGYNEAGHLNFSLTGSRGNIYILAEKEKISNFSWVLSAVDNTTVADFSSIANPVSPLSLPYFYFNTYAFSANQFLDNSNFQNYSGRLKLSITANQGSDIQKTVMQYFAKPTSLYPVIGVVTESGDKAKLTRLDDGQTEEIAITNGMFEFNGDHGLLNGKFKIEIFANGTVAPIKTHFFNKSKTIRNSGHVYIAIVDTPVAPVAVVQPPTLSLSISPSSINASESAVLTWSSSNVASCRFRDGTNEWRNQAWQPSGSFTASELTAGNYAFTLECTGSNGASVSDSKSLVVVESAITSSVSISHFPANELPGDRILVYGANFSEATEVYFGDIISRNKAHVYFKGVDVIEVTVPNSGSGSVRVYVLNPGQSATPWEGFFTFKSPLPPPPVTEDNLTGKCIFGGNNQIEAAVFCQEQLKVADGASNLDFLGSFVSGRFEIPAVSRGVKFRYNTNISKNWPPGFRYLEATAK